jgi:hypothetical protein
LGIESKNNRFFGIIQDLSFNLTQGSHVNAIYRCATLTCAQFFM